jgi:hypothetical protein
MAAVRHVGLGTHRIRVGVNDRDIADLFSIWFLVNIPLVDEYVPQSPLGIL